MIHRENVTNGTILAFTSTKTGFRRIGRVKDQYMFEWHEKGRRQLHVMFDLAKYDLATEGELMLFMLENS